MTLAGIAVRILILLAAIVVATWVSSVIREALDLTVMPHNERIVHRSIMIATGVFILLLAIPFVPGAEIGLTMLTVFGAPIAPLVYGATVCALMLAYAVGRLVPPDRVVGALRALRLPKAADAVAHTLALPREERLARFMDTGAPRALHFATRFRYLVILLAINLPGNVLIGGGGGIALMAGMSGLFAPLPFLVTVAIAVSPVPLVVSLFGA